MQYHADAVQVAARYASISAQAGNALFVAEEAGTVVGWAHVRLVELLQVEPYAALVGLAVLHAARRERVGASLVSACRAWAKQQGHADVRLP